MSKPKWKPFSELENVQGTNQKSVHEILPEFADMLSFFQTYPDKFIDYILPSDSTFDLYPFQRIYLRVMARYKKVYITATRGTSKSFLNILSMYLKCIFFPNIKLSLVAPQKDQASQIAQQNIEAIWNFIPALEKEIKSKTFAKDFTRIKFYNNSVLDIVVASQGSRGLRRHGLSFEEICQMEKHREVIGEVLLPLLANNRKGADGKVSKHEIHKQLMYVTTASSRQSYAWEQLRSVMIDMAMMVENQDDPNNKKSAFVIGNDYHLPVMFEQLDPDYVDEVKNDPSMSPLQFAREYMSVWTGSSENSLVQLKDLEKCRVLTNAEFEYTKGKIEAKYIISVDVARSDRKGSATTAIAVFKLVPRGNGTFWKQLVNLHTYRGNMHFEEQSIYIKDLVEKFKASMVVIDGNGLGRGLLDYLVKEDKHPSYSVVNDDGTYEKYKLPNSLPLIFNMMTNTKETSASNVYNNFMAVISNNDLKMLIPDSIIKEKSKEQNLERLTEKLIPYTETGLFIDEVMNLIYEARGNNTIIKRVSKSMDKDRFSAVSYGLYYIYLEEQKNKQRKKESFNVSGMFAVKQPKYRVFD